MILAVACALACLVPQGEKVNPDLKYFKESGFSVQKPPKNDEWDFKEQGFFTNSKLMLKHKVDEILVDITVEPPAPNGWDVKKTAENSFDQLSGKEDFAGMGTRKIERIPLPGGGASGVAAFMFRAPCTDKAGAKKEVQVYYFSGKENGCLYRVFIYGDEGMYKKHQKVVDFALGNFRTYKLAKN